MSILINKFDLNQFHEITKRNKPIAKLVPLKKTPPLFGKMKGTAHIKGDLIEPIGEEWDACL